MGELAALLDLASDRLGFLQVLPAGRHSGLPWSCADIVASQDAGKDPTAPWRAQISENQAEFYGGAQSPAIPAAFVQQWYLGVLANPLATIAALGAWVIDVAPEAVRFDVSDGDGFPVAMSTDLAGAAHVVDNEKRIELARQRYLSHAVRFVKGYRPGVKMGSPQRAGMIEDVWEMAVSAAFDDDSGMRDFRRSCCFIFALPGAVACARCPRRRVRP